MSQIPFGEIRDWTFQHALPLWGSAGIDHEAGGFHEELGLDGAPTGVDFKRVRAICRQTYVFSHAALLGWAPGAALSQQGYDYLIAKAWLGEGKGWAKTLTRAGDVRDASQDLYDLAFVMFALAWRHRLARDADSLAHLHATLDFIHANLRAEEGFWHALPPTGPRLQNPHMHLLEASLAAFDASADERFLDQAHEIVGLFRRRFFDGRTLGERFSADLTRMSDAAAREVEPGHHFEWAWILAQYHRLTGEDVSREAEALVDFAERFGVDRATQAVSDTVRDDGAPMQRTARTWPNTERLKGWLALTELGLRDGRAQIAGSARLLLDRYLSVSPRGSWMDQFDEAGRPLAKAAPASTFYHVFLAFAEVLRLEEKLAQTP